MRAAQSVAAAIAVVLLGGCTGPGTGTAGACVDDALEAYRSVEPPASTGVADRFRQLARDYGEATEQAARVASDCAGDAAVDQSCRAALEELGDVLREAGASAVRAARSRGIERAAATVDEHQARLEGAAAATAACGR